MQLFEAAPPGLCRRISECFSGPLSVVSSPPYLSYIGFAGVTLSSETVPPTRLPRPPVVGELNAFSAKTVLHLLWRGLCSDNASFDRISSLRSGGMVCRSFLSPPDMKMFFYPLVVSGKSAGSVCPDTSFDERFSLISTL